MSRRRRRRRATAALAALCLIGFFGMVTYELWPRPADAPAGAGTPAHAGGTVVSAAGRTRSIHSPSNAPSGATSQGQRVDSGAAPQWGAADPPAVTHHDDEPGEPSPIAETHGDAGTPPHVPFLAAWNSSNVEDLENHDPAGLMARLDVPNFASIGGGGAGTGTTGSSSATTPTGTPRPSVGDLTGTPTTTTTPGTTTTGGTTGSTTTTGETTTGGTTPGVTTTGSATTGGETTGNPTPTDDVATTTSGDTTTGDLTTTGLPTTNGIVLDETTGGSNSDGAAPSVPEPTLLVLLGFGACSAAARRLRGRRD